VLFLLVAFSVALPKTTYCRLLSESATSVLPKLSECRSKTVAKNPRSSISKLYRCARSKNGSDYLPLAFGLPTRKVSSTTGQLVVTFGQANYAAAKAGVIGFTKALAVELARSNITVNAVAIGAMATEMWDTVPDVIKETIYEKIPMHRACTTEEVARGVRFLAVEGAYITGHALNMDGGLYQG
jgi:hypothetical protein